MSHTTPFRSWYDAVSSRITGRSRPIQVVEVKQAAFHDIPLDRWFAGTRYLEASNPVRKRYGISFGSSDNPDEALMKAVMEGLEAHARSRCRVDIESAAADLATAWLDPRMLYPYEEWQLRHLRRILRDFSFFQPPRKWQWVSGYYLNSLQPVMVPVDLVFSGITSRSFDRPPCLKSVSSGLAAHMNKDAAIENAVLELIERDALMVTWYARLPVRAISSVFLSPATGARISNMQRLGFQVKFLDLTLDSVPVVLCLVTGRNGAPGIYPGCAAARSLAVAMEKAYGEAEMAAVTWQFVRRLEKQPQNIRTIRDHGFLYGSPVSMEHIQWLLDASEAKPKCSYSDDNFLQRFDPVIVDITPEDYREIGVFVVRALSSHLLPVNFGYGTEHGTHRRFADLNMTWQESRPAYPHFFF